MKRIVLISLVLLAAASQAARGEIILLWPDGSGDYPTIQAAIDDANDGDVIYLFPGTYTGPNNTDIDFLGKSITVQSVAPEFPSIVAATIIDCNGTEADPHRGFDFQNYEDANAVLAGLTITRGAPGIIISYSNPTIAYCTITGCFSPGRGGGIYCSESEPVIINCTFTNNSADYGGGIECFRSTAIIENCTFTGNSARFGGALHSEGTYYYGRRLQIANCTFTGNSAAEGGGGICCDESDDIEIVDSVISHNYSAGGGGGGLMGWGPGTTLTITNSTISHNTSQYSPSEGRGGGIWWGGSDIHINGCTISANKAASDGGGVFFDIYGSARVSATMKNTRISGNRAGNNGGAIFGGPPDLTFFNCIVSGNAAFESGGGLHSAEGGRMPEMINTTIADNWAGLSAGGIYGSCPDSPLVMTNSILWGNADSSGTGLLAQLRSCGTQADAYAIFSCIQDDNPDDANIPFGADPNFNIDDDPCFIMRGFWADANDPNVIVGPNDPNAVWVAGDYHLLIDSPCIDAGSSAALPLAKSFSIDFDGEPRVTGQDVDMGADEFGLVVIVNSPQQADVWVGASLHEINWYSYQTAGTVDISYSDDNGASWVPIEASVPDTGSYTWQVPTSVDSTQSLVRVVPAIPEPNVIIIDSAPFTIHPDFIHPAVPSEWPSLAGGFDRSSLSANLGPEVGCVRWQFQTDSPVVSSVTAGPAGRTHIACEDGKLYTLDSAGALVWTFDANSPILSAPTVGPDGSIYVGTEDGILYAVSIAGTVRWTHRTGGFIFSSPAVSTDGDIYVGSADGRLYALANNGTLLWTFQTDPRGAGVQGPIFASPAIALDGTVYIGGLYDPNLYALDPNDGTVKWVCNFEHTILVQYDEDLTPEEVNVANWPFASPVVAADGTIYQGLLFDEEIFAIEPVNGTVLWTANFAAPNIEGFDYCYYLRPCEWRDLPPDYFYDWTWSRTYSEVYLQKYPSVDGWLEPALGPDGTIYLSLDEDPFLRAVEPNGTVRWVRNVGIMGGFTLAVGADGLLYIASDDGHLTVLEPDGTEIARFRGDGPLQFPVIADNGTIIITDSNNTVKQIAASGCDGLPAALHRPEDLDGSWMADNVDFAMLADNWMECVELLVDPPDWETPPYILPFSDLPIYLQGDIDRDFAVSWRDLRLLTDRWLTSD
ncbi:MAG: PQQ-binding-like beta-propeller repeat protein [Planctomycetota bacterium]|nr:MAG: PQQ-binding-like beta-propeller repeat protein [Planctomycetota bacterium]